MARSRSVAARSGGRGKSPAKAKAGGDYNADGTIKTINAGMDISTVVKCKNGVKLYKCVPTEFLWMPRWLRLVCGWLLVGYFVSLFMVLPLAAAFLHPFFWTTVPRRVCSALYLVSMVASMYVPLKEWPALKPLAQLWYELFDISCSLSPDDRKAAVERGCRFDAANVNGSITAMHPHGIVPFQALFWASYTSQYLEMRDAGADKNSEAKHSLYGFAAAANAVFSLPFLRNLLGWFATHGANYDTLKDGLLHGKNDPCNNVGRTPKHLFLLPGGIAEVFTSEVGRHAVVFKQRRGLCRLALECRSEIIPVYIFGGNDFYENLFSAKSFVGNFSRRMKIGKFTCLLCLEMPGIMCFPLLLFASCCCLLVSLNSNSALPLPLYRPLPTYLLSCFPLATSHQV